MARFNRRPRMRFGHRFFRRPAARKPKWTTQNFNESALDLDGSTALELTLLDPATLYSAEDEEIGRILSVRRVICSGSLNMVPVTTGTSSEICNLLWALYTLDRDDADTITLGTGPNTIWTSERVMQTGLVSWTMLEAPSGGGFAQNLLPGQRIDFDLRTNISMRNDQLLVVGLRFMSDVTSTVALANVSAVTRCLVYPP